MSLPKVIAIDGPAASGKSTLGEKLAAYLGYLYFDTGVMYRAVTWMVLRSHTPVNDELSVTALANRIQIDVFSPSVDDGRKCDVFVDGEDVTWDIRSSDVEEYVSLVAAYPGVRRAMTDQQRRIVDLTVGSNEFMNFKGDQNYKYDNKIGGIIMVGRDIGTVVVPDAKMKIYLDASVEERARRRFEEVSEKDSNASYDEIYQSMLRRDKIDSTRVIAPLRPADDAIIINTDGMNIDLVLDQVKKLLGIT